MSQPSWAWGSACFGQRKLSAVTSAGLPRHCPGPRATIHGQTALIVDTVHQVLSFELGLVFLPWMYCVFHYFCVFVQFCIVFYIFVCSMHQICVFSLMTAQLFNFCFASKKLTAFTNIWIDRYNQLFVSSVDYNGNQSNSIRHSGFVEPIVSGQHTPASQGIVGNQAHDCATWQRSDGHYHAWSRPGCLSREQPRIKTPTSSKCRFGSSWTGDSRRME